MIVYVINVGLLCTAPFLATLAMVYLLPTVSSHPPNAWKLQAMLFLLIVLLRPWRCASVVLFFSLVGIMFLQGPRVLEADVGNDNDCLRTKSFRSVWRVLLLTSVTGVVLVLVPAA